jgi:hypothetical protein
LKEGRIVDAKGYRHSAERRLLTGLILIGLGRFGHGFRVKSSPPPAPARPCLECKKTHTNRNTPWCSVDCCQSYRVKERAARPKAVSRKERMRLQKQAAREAREAELAALRVEKEKEQAARAAAEAEAAAALEVKVSKEQARLEAKARKRQKRLEDKAARKARRRHNTPGTNPTVTVAPEETV